MSDVTAKKSLGQHWLRDVATLSTICQAADIKPGDTVLEIGPGQGSLTSILLEQGASVIAVELDERLANELERKFSGRSFILNTLSILDFDFTSLATNYKIVANIPYYLSAHLLRLLCETLHKPQIAVLLLQKEVAVRVAARPADMSLLSVVVQLEYQVSRGQIVPAKLFEPAPKVDSQILIMTKRAQPLFNDVELKSFLRLVKAGFANRRKTLLNSLSAGLQLPKDDVKTILALADIKPATRAQELSLDDWHRLYLSVK